MLHKFASKIKNRISLTSSDNTTRVETKEDQQEMQQIIPYAHQYLQRNSEIYLHSPESSPIALIIKNYALFNSYTLCSISCDYYNLYNSTIFLSYCNINYFHSTHSLYVEKHNLICMDVYTQLHRYLCTVSSKHYKPDITLRYASQSSTYDALRAIHDKYHSADIPETQFLFSLSSIPEIINTLEGVICL